MDIGYVERAATLALIEHGVYLTWIGADPIPGGFRVHVDPDGPQTRISAEADYSEGRDLDEWAASEIVPQLLSKIGGA